MPTEVFAMWVEQWYSNDADGMWYHPEGPYLEYAFFSISALAVIYYKQRERKRAEEQEQKA